MVTWDSIISAIIGSGSSAAIALYFLKKAISELEETIKEIAKIKSDMAVLASKIETNERSTEILRDHDRKIAAMESILYGFRNQGNSFTKT